ncbi:MAG: sensor histidine kinase [Proteobacteria bacterium]|nr:sensor histidine kinase [Pseudomonadota bacterium]
MIIKKSTIRKKILGGFIGVTLLTVPLIILNSYGYKQIDYSLNVMVEEAVPQLQALYEMQNSVTRIQMIARQLKQESDQETEASDKRYELLAAIDNFLHFQSEYLKLAKNSKLHTINTTTLNDLMNRILSISLSFEELQVKHASTDENEKLESQLAEQISILNNLIDQTTADNEGQFLSLRKSTTDKIENKLTQNLFLGLLMLTAGIGVSLVLSHHISKPIIRLSDIAKRITKGDYAAVKNLLVEKKENDEIVVLSQAFNRMVTTLLEQLKELQENQHKIAELNQSLIDAAWKAGSAEVAASVLHNVGNVLNSVNVSVKMIQESLLKNPTAKLDKVINLIDANSNRLTEFITQDKHGKHMIEYLKKMDENGKKHLQKNLEEIKLLEKNLTHVKEIVECQQNSGKNIEVIEEISIDHLIEMNLKVSMIDFSKVKVLKNYSSLPKTRVDRIRLQKILTNMIRMSYESVMVSTKENKIITVSANIESKNNKNYIKIEVQDNGIGIEAKDLKNIFNYKFSTKEAGNDFGLHASALAAKSQGGSLACFSDGLNQGTKFILILPCEIVG